MDSSNVNTKTKKMIVITPDQIAKLGLTLKLQSVIAPQLQKRKSIEAATTENTTPVNKNARKPRVPKAETKKLDGGSRKSLPAKKNETSVKDSLSEVVGDLVVRPAVLKAKLKSVLDSTEPETAKPKTTCSTPKVTPKGKTKPRISKAKQANTEKLPENTGNPLNLVGEEVAPKEKTKPRIFKAKQAEIEKVPENTENPFNLVGEEIAPKEKTKPRISKAKQADIEKIPENTGNPLSLIGEEIATTPISKSNKKTPRNSKKVVPANQPSIKSFFTSSPTNSKFTIIQNEVVNLNQNTIDSIMSETKMSPDGSIRLSDSIILGNTSPRYSTSYKSPERFSADSVGKGFSKVDLENRDSDNKKDSYNVLEGAAVVDKKEERKIYENVGLTEGKTENPDIKETVEETSKIHKSGSAIRLEFEIDKGNENTESSDKEGNVQNSKSSDVTKDVTTVVAKAVTRRGRVKVAPKLAPKLVSDDSKIANIESCKTIEDINQHSSSTSDSNLNIESQEKIEGCSKDSVKSKIEAPEYSGVVNRRSRIKAVVNIKPNVNPEPNKEILEHDKTKIEAPEDSRVANRRSRIKAVVNTKPNVNVETIKEIFEHDKNSDKESTEKKGASTNFEIISDEERNKKVGKEVPTVTNRRSRIKPAVNLGRKLKVNLKPTEEVSNKVGTKIVAEEVPTEVQVISDETNKIDNDIRLSAKVVATKTPPVHIQIISEKEIKTDKEVPETVSEEVSTEISVPSRNVQSVVEEEKKIYGKDLAEEVLSKTSVDLFVHRVAGEEKKIDQTTIEELPEKEKGIVGVVQRTVEAVSTKTSDSSMNIETMSESEIKIGVVVEKSVGEEVSNNTLIGSTNAQPSPEEEKTNIEIETIGVSINTPVSSRQVQEIPEGEKKIDEVVQTTVEEVSTKTSMNIVTISDNQVKIDGVVKKRVAGEVPTDTQISSTNAKEKEKESVELEPIEEVSTKTSVSFTHVQEMPEGDKKIEIVLQTAVGEVSTTTSVNSMNIVTISESELKIDEEVKKTVDGEVPTKTSISSTYTLPKPEEEKKSVELQPTEEVSSKTPISLIHAQELSEDEKKIDEVVQTRVGEVSTKTSVTSTNIDTISEIEVKIDGVVNETVKGEDASNTSISSTNGLQKPEEETKSVQLQPIEEVSTKTPISLTHAQEISEDEKKIDEVVQARVGEVSTKISVTSTNVETISEIEMKIDGVVKKTVKGEVSSNTSISPINALQKPEEEKKSVELQPIEEVSTKTPISLSHAQEILEDESKIVEVVQARVGEVSTKTSITSTNIDTISQIEVKIDEVVKETVKGEVSSNTSISSTNALQNPEEEKKSVELQPIEEVSTKTPISLTHAQEISEDEKKIHEMVQRRVGEVSTKPSVSLANIEQVSELDEKIRGLVKKTVKEEGAIEGQLLGIVTKTQSNVQSIPEKKNIIDEVVSTTPKTLVRRGRIKNIVKIPQRSAKKKSEEKTSVAETEINLKEATVASIDKKNNENKITAELESSVGELIALKEDKEKNTNKATNVICRKSKTEKLEENDSGADLISSCTPTESMVNSNEEFGKMEEKTSVSNDNENLKQNSKSNKDFESNPVTITSTRGRGKRGNRIGEKSVKELKDEKSEQMEKVLSSNIECNDVNRNEKNEEMNKSKLVISGKDCNKDDLVETNQIYYTSRRGRGERKSIILYKSATNAKEKVSEKHEICNKGIFKEDAILANENESMTDNSAKEEAKNNVEQPSCNTGNSKNIVIVKEKEDKKVKKKVSTVSQNLNAIDEKGKGRRKVSPCIIDNLMEDTNAGNNCKVEDKKGLEENLNDEKEDKSSNGRTKRRTKGTSILDFIKSGKKSKAKKEQDHRISSRSRAKGFAENVKDQTDVCEIDTTMNESEVEKVESEDLIINKKRSIKVSNKIDINTKNKIFSRKSVNEENDTEGKIKSSRTPKQLESMECAEVSNRSIIEEKGVDKNKTPKNRRRKSSQKTPDSDSISHSPSNINQSGRHVIKNIDDQINLGRNDTDKITTDFESPELKNPEIQVEGNLINKTFNESKSEENKQRVEGANATDKEAWNIGRNVDGRDEVVFVIKKKKRGRKSKAELAAIAELEKQNRKRRRSSSAEEEILPKRTKKVDYVSLSGAEEKEEKPSRKRKLSPAPEPKPKKKNVEDVVDEFEQYTRGNQTRIMIKQMVEDMQKIIDQNIKVWKEKKRKMDVKGIVICIICNKELKTKEWHCHKYRHHNNLAWRVGEQALDLSENNVNAILNLLYKNKKCMYCSLCEKSLKSPYGYLCHYVTCGKSPEEIESLKVACKICGTLSYKFMFMEHLKIHSRPVRDEIPETIETDEPKREPNRKRNAATRANAIIKNVSSQIGNEDNESELKKFYTKRNLKKSDLERIFAGNKKEIQCIYTKCKETFNQTEEIFEHLKNCTNRGKDKYICKLCAAGFESAQNVMKHLNTKHEEILDENYNISEDEECEEDFEEPVDGEMVTKRPSKSYSYFNEKWKSCNLKFCAKSTCFVKELSSHFDSGNYLRNLAFCERNFTQDVFENFPFIRSNFIAVDPRKIMDYLPKQKQSIEVGFQVLTSTKSKYQGQFTKLKLFETHNHLGRITTYCGGPITCMAWAPTPYTSQKHKQILAVSVMSDYDGTYTYAKRCNEKSVIQFWNYGVLNNNNDVEAEAKFEFGLAHNFGPILSMEWCPSGCNDEDRLGLLAVSGSDGNVYGFAIGQPGKIKHKIVTAKPSFKLVLDGWSDADLGNRESFPTRISWTKAAGHSFISVGYSSGIVAIFNLMTENDLLSKSDGDTVVFYPYIKFQAHLSAVTGITLHFLNGGKRWLATGSGDKESKFWDLDNLSDPIWIVKRFYTRQLIWLQNWLCTVEAFDDYGNSAVHPISAVYIKDFGSPHSVTLLHTGSQVGAISINEWGNLIMQGNDVGEVSGCYNKHYFPFQSDLACKKYFFGKLNVIANEDSKNKDKHNFYKERSFQGASNMFKMVFADLPLKHYATVMKYGATATSNSPANFTELKSNRYLLESVSYLAINPNRYSFLYSATGYQSGFLRVFRSDFLKRNIIS